MFEVYDITILPLIIGLVELFKRMGFPSKYSPIIGMIAGLLIGIFYVAPTIKEGILIGLVLGLSASGLYSGTKNIVESVKLNNNKEE